MKNDRTGQHSSKRLVRIAPIVRGLLARPTGNEDVPYEGVILKSLTNKEAVDFAGCSDNAKAEQYPTPLSKGQKPPLFLDNIDYDAEPEELRNHLSNRISDYSQQHNCKPLIICVRDEGILYLDPEEGEPDWSLNNKVALVTGAAGAIGYGVCCGLLEKGCRLAATDLAGDKLDGFVDDLKQTAGGHVLGVGLDVLIRSQLAGVLKASLKPGAELTSLLLMPAFRWFQI